jgi:hypothetical protein
MSRFGYSLSAWLEQDSKKGDLERIETNEFSSGKGTFRGLETA